MQEKSVYTYYCFGYNYRMLYDDNQGITIKTLRGRLEELFEQFDGLDLRVTEAAAEDLHKIVDEIDDLKPTDKVSEELNSRVCDAVHKLDSTLDAELGLVKAFVLTPKRFDLRHLLETPKHLFAKGATAILETDVKRDLVLGFQCIAYECATGAAFHLLRATEGSLRQMYNAYIKRNRLSKPMWHGMVEALRSKRKPRPSEELLDHLDVIRRNYRNPTQHPDKFYTVDEAQDLASNCIAAINMMSKAIEKQERPPTR